jgi:hypothetical protein
MAVPNDSMTKTKSEINAMNKISLEILNLKADIKQCVKHKTKVMTRSS